MTTFQAHNILTSWMGFHVTPPLEMTLLTHCHCPTYDHFSGSQYTNLMDGLPCSTFWNDFIDSPAIAQHMTTFQAHNIPTSWMGFHVAPSCEMTLLTALPLPTIYQQESQLANRLNFGSDSISRCGEVGSKANASIQFVTKESRANVHSINSSKVQMNMETMDGKEGNMQGESYHGQM